MPYDPGVSTDLIAVPRIDIYGEPAWYTTRFLEGGGVVCRPGSVYTVNVTCWGGGSGGNGGGGGSGGSNSMSTGSGYTSGGGTGGGGAASGSASWGQWACYAYGNSVVNPRDLIMITGVS